MLYDTLVSNALPVSTNLCVYTQTHTHIYIYIEGEREIERERASRTFMPPSLLSLLPFSRLLKGRRCQAQSTDIASVVCRLQRSGLGNLKFRACGLGVRVKALCLKVCGSGLKVCDSG